MNTKEEGSKETAVPIWSAIRLPLITILAYGILYQPIDRLFANWVAEPHLSKIGFKGNVTAQVSLFLLFAIGLLWLIKQWRKGFQYSLSRIAWLGAALLFYAFLRFLNPNNWQLTEWLSAGGVSIKAFDLLFALCAVQFLSGLRTCFSRKEACDNLQKNKGFLTDEPREISTHDGHQRGRYIETIVGLLGETDTSKRAFAIGISGVWGSGKTSFMMGLEEQLKSGFSHLHFNPWRISRSKDLTEAFFEELSHKISENTDTVADDMDDYVRGITTWQNAAWYTTLVKVFFPRVRWNRDSVESLHSSINGKLWKLPKKYVIYIDDLDRLDRQEIGEVLRIVRNSADFANLIFVVAYDKGQVVSALSEKFGAGSTTYLEKVFQHEFHLPPMHKSAIMADLEKQLRIVLAKGNKEKEESREPLFENKTTAFFRKHILSHRDVARYVNAFKVHYQFIEGEIHLPDLHKIKLLRLKYPQIASLLYKKRRNYLDGFGVSDETGYTLLKGEPITLQSKDGTIPLKQELERNPSDYGVLSKNVDDIIAMVESIFAPTITSGMRNNPKDTPAPFSIRLYRYFDRYFDEDLSSRLPNKEFVQEFDKTEEVFLAAVGKWILRNEVALDLIETLDRQGTFAEKADFEKVLSAYATIYDYKDTEGKYAYDSQVNGFKIYALIERLKNAVKTNSKGPFGTSADFKAYILEILSSKPDANHLYFATLKEYAGRKEQPDPLISQEEAKPSRSAG